MNTQLLCCFSALVLSSLQVSGSFLTYRAAVVEYHPVWIASESSRVEANVENYKKFISEAKSKGAEIVVFPENGLLTKETRCYIPDPAENDVPCHSTNPKYHKIVKDLSCASEKHRIYSVINLVEKRDCGLDDENCPPRGYYVFNTNVVFDRAGAVIARYAKYNLFDEPFNNRTQDPEIVFFETDFGVTFGTFTCFDILFSAPAQKLVHQFHVTDFVFTTFWFSELPFLTALQVQRGWAETNDVNLLASGVNQPSTGSGGSGIYNGKFGQIVQVMPETSASRLLIADVPRIQKTSCTNLCETKSPFTEKPNPTPPTKAFISEPQSGEDFQLLQDQMNLYSSEVIEGGKTFEKTICSHDLCCDFRVTMDALKPESKNYSCRAVTFNGIRKFGQSFRGGVQSCGVVVCNGPDIKNCTSRMKNIPGMFRFKAIQIKGSFNLRNSFQIPSTLTDGKQLKPLPVEKYQFTKKTTDNALEVSLELLWPVTDLRTFAIWGRDFTRDMEPQEEPESGASAPVTTPAILASFFAFLLFVR